MADKTLSLYVVGKEVNLNPIARAEARGEFFHRTSTPPAATNTFELSKESDAAVAAIGVQNLYDAASQYSQAASATNELQNNLATIADYADVASIAVTSSTQRDALDAEAARLVTEYSRIVASVTSASGNLVSGSISTFRLQAGFGEQDLSLKNLNQDLSAVDLSSSVSADSSISTLSTAAYNLSVGASLALGNETRISAAASIASTQAEFSKQQIVSSTPVESAGDLARSIASRIRENDVAAYAAHSLPEATRVLQLLKGAF